jgi:arginyl-tRNA synthetase
MKDPASEIESRVLAAMRDAFGDRLPAGADALVGPARNPEHGDFQSNAAMPLGKRLGSPPRDVAQAIVDRLDVADLCDVPTIAGPGFINFRLRDDALAAALEALDTPALGVDPPETVETVVVDLCGVNLAKQMHVGHIRATVIGDALARLHERLGHTVIRQNHFGDWGLPIAMVTDAVRRAAEAGEVDLATLGVVELEAMYRAAQARASADRAGLAAVERFDLGPKARAELEEQVAGAEEALAEAKGALVALQRHDEPYYSVWKRISEITLDSCFDNCARLHARVGPEATAGESTYGTALGEVVEDLAAREVAEESQGALVIRLEDHGIKEPVLVRKSDGGYLYATTDLAAIRRRVRDLGADRILYAVDARQSLHFKQVFAGADRAGYLDKPSGNGKAEAVHAAFGTILGEDGKPFKTRSGDNVKLSDLLDEAVDRAEKAVGEKNPDLPPDERRRVAEAVGIGAIKHADLSSDRLRDYVFSFDRMLAFEGNTGPYLQYALVRIYSIFRKAQERFGVSMDDASGDFQIEAPEEKAIALELLKYAGVLQASADACEPHRLVTYLYELATAFSSFFAACPVLQAEDEATRNSRLRLCALTGRVLRDGLETLGLTPLERM